MPRGRSWLRVDALMFCKDPYYDTVRATACSVLLTLSQERFSKNSELNSIPHTLSVFWWHPVMRSRICAGRHYILCEMSRQFALQLSPDVEYSAELWMFKILND